MTDVGVGWSRTLPFVGIGAVVACNVAGSIFIKFGANAPANRAMLFGFLGWQTILGIGCFAVSVLLYAWVLRQIPLYLAQSIAVLQFIGIILAAAMIFGEPISVRQWAGMALIILGLAVVAG